MTRLWRARRRGAQTDADASRLSLDVKGQLSTVLLGWNDGERTFWRYGDTTLAPSLVNVTASFRADSRLDAHLIYEGGYTFNSSGSATQVPEVVEPAGIDNRRAQIVLDHDRYGVLYVGKGSNATDTIAQNDLSGTEIAMHGTYADTGGGFRLRDENGDLTETTFGEIYADFDGDRRSRMRYDTPGFGGFTASLSADVEGTWGAALRYQSTRGTPTARRNGADFEAGLGVRASRLDTVAMGSATKKLAKLGRGHVEGVVAGGWRWWSRDEIETASGAASGATSADPRRDAGYVYAKLAWRGTLIAWGETAMSVDGRVGGGNLREISRSNSIGFQISQALGTDAAHATAGVRWYDVDGPAQVQLGPTVLAGTLFRF